MTRLSIDISDELHHCLKVHTAYKNQTIMNFVREAIYSKIEKEKKLNKESIRVIEESKKGFGISSFKSLEELYKDLGI